MTTEERMAIATRYQNMKADEIIKMQNEMMEMTPAQAEFQQIASEFETPGSMSSNLISGQSLEKGSGR